VKEKRTLVKSVLFLFLEESMIRRVSVLLVATVFMIACSSTNDPNAKAKRGAGVGAAAGAVAGAVIGNQSGNNRTGAVAGAVATVAPVSPAALAASRTISLPAASWNRPPA